MIGNDVIDLKLAAAESDWRRKGFLEKLFSGKEIAMILSSAAPDVSVWNLWSRKEAAYKIFNRTTGMRLFNPLYFECRDLSASSYVFFAGQTVFCRTEITPDFIHTVACEKTEYFQHLLTVHQSEITKMNGLPFFEKAEKPHIATVSHHGNFVKCVSLVGNGLNLDLAVQGPVDGTFLGDLK
ncbi:4'-phosphopantetheinyl transferase family protein [Flavobacterium selenitireducens]|uniref:4'-phosphopantetheinyl transferase family protein n=1 Tax=Flavobacterium selenitireducens TaxID=2722704 RepID=UPI00168B828B|nr:4'-phosphopantetheinyl transferase superfamily protein [Flavobacterium selenitireducens]MBD3581013.1 4-phosphopantetheinyl transferase family protein [Flavobacterium selenitireducens]